MSHLVDTNVVSELRKGSRGDPGVASWFARTPSEEIYLSVLTIGELRKGIEKKRGRDPAASRFLEDWLTKVLDSYADRILAVDQAVAEQWGRDNFGDPLPVLDSLLAATAKVHGLTFVTRNTKDVERTGVALLNPFAGQPIPPALSTHPPSD